MASLDKLAIRGIRSFDDKKVSVIQFYSPVTVIVGHNGSGKTTIIECLKYATTGDQPPNTRGGAFIHDPKIANEKEVKAQVKLRFRAANDARMTAVRNLSLTVKKGGGVTMKTLESILALDPADEGDAGKRNVISTKCAEIDSEVPQLLGVSKAVLDNVIFCHQEESYWPLSEASVLKKKFDDIFEATRYTKALSSIKDLRKERVSDLKADRERLNALQSEKAHADRLRSKIDDLASTVTAKEIELEELSEDLEHLTTENAKFYDTSTSFKETYIRIENLENRKQHLVSDMEEAAGSIQELDESDDVLEGRRQNFETHVAEQEQKKAERAAALAKEESGLAKLRAAHLTAVSERAALVEEQKAQKRNTDLREEMIHTISAKHNVRGFEHSPIEAEEVIEFTTMLTELRRKQNVETERIQSEGRTKAEEYQNRLQALHKDHVGYVQECDNVRSQINKLQNTIATNEAKVDSSGMLEADIKYNAGNIEEKTIKLEKLKVEFEQSRYDVKYVEKGREIKACEEKREELNTELRTLSLQADSRAKLELKRADAAKKKDDVKVILEGNSTNYRRLIGADAKLESMESDVEKATMQKEREAAELDGRAQATSKSLHQIEASLTADKQKLKTDKAEIGKLQARIKAVIEKEEMSDVATRIDKAIEEALSEIANLNELITRNEGAAAFWQLLLENGRKKRACAACCRKLDSKEFGVFEANIIEKAAKTTDEQIAEWREDVKMWERAHTKLQAALPLQISLDQLQATGIASLEKRVREGTEECATAAAQTNQANDACSQAKTALKELQALKVHATFVARTKREIEQLQKEVKQLEKDLVSTGSTRTADDVQRELDEISMKMKALDRERTTVMTERDRHVSHQRQIKDEIHELKLTGSELSNKFNEHKALQAAVENSRKDVVALKTRLKAVEARLTASQEPIQKLEFEQQQFRSDLSTKTAQAQRMSQELNISADKLDAINRTVNRYIRDNREAQLARSLEKVSDLDSEITSTNTSLEQLRRAIAKIEKEINERGGTLANLRENLRFRRLRRDIEAVDGEIEVLDIEGAGIAKEAFDREWAQRCARVEGVKKKHAHLSGEVGTYTTQLESSKKDLKKEFKDVHKLYTDQLIKVKMSDMANADLEKYGKALDNAIMKYHSLKMEEVNDTMRHLWNKTYQGTDIDGIKIAAESEGATKRAYNYRVVMTKDQVEMDMRGRCSAGQKMLASIIIRLALSDSFGQNCGILALDEPTNALDTENIDALASSLVDIINERRGQANFQLIIITHDESFLRKLGQAEVMDYYWRVSRDGRQKSMIERQRFG